VNVIEWSIAIIVIKYLQLLSLSIWHENCTRHNHILNRIPGMPEWLSVPNSATSDPANCCRARVPLEISCRNVCSLFLFPGNSDLMCHLLPRHLGTASAEVIPSLLSRSYRKLVQDDQSKMDLDRVPSVQYESNVNNSSSQLTKIIWVVSIHSSLEKSVTAVAMRAHCMKADESIGKCGASAWVGFIICSMNCQTKLSSQWPIDSFQVYGKNCQNTLHVSSGSCQT